MGKCTEERQLRCLRCPLDTGDHNMNMTQKKHVEPYHTFAKLIYEEIYCKSHVVKSFMKQEMKI